METFPIQHPDLFDERPPIRPEDIQRLNTHVQTLELQYEATKGFIQQRAGELLVSGDDWSDEDFIRIQDLKSRLDTLENDFFGYFDLPYDIAKSFTLVQSKYYRYLDNIDMGLFGKSEPSKILEDLSRTFEWGERDDNTVRGNFLDARVHSMDFDIFEREVQLKHQDFIQRGQDIRKRLNDMVANEENDFEVIETDLRSLTTEISDFNQEIRRISYSLPDLSREDERDISNGNNNPYQEGSPEYVLYEKHQIIWKLSNDDGQRIYDNIHSMAFEIGTLERQNDFNEGLQRLEAINLGENPQEFFQFYKELLGAQSQSLGYGASESNRSQALSNVGKVFEVFKSSIREYGRNNYIQTILVTEGYFYDPILRAHFPIEGEFQTSISDFPTLVDIYDGIIPQARLEQETTNYIVSESSFEGGLGSNVQFNLDNEEFRRFRPDVRGLKIGGLDSIFTRDDDRVFRANEMSHIAFSNMMGDNELYSFLGNKNISSLTDEQQISAKNIAEIDELLSDMSSLNSLELNDENRERIVEEILRIFAFIFTLDGDNNIEDSNYDATAQVMRQVIQDILIIRGISGEEIEGIFSISSLENTRSFIEGLEFSDDEILMIQQRYLEVGRTALEIAVGIRDRVIIAESLMGRVTPNGNPLNKFEKEIVQSVFQELGYYDGVIDGIWGINTQNAYIEYRKDRFGE